MGIFSSLIGGVLGVAGPLLGGGGQAKSERKAADKAAQTARLGFDYLSKSPLATQYLPAGGRANAAQADLLGIGGDPTAANNAFDTYRKSTGYDFQMKEGQNAIASSAAARGTLNSGATLKALTKYGQGLGGNAFQTYLANLGSLSATGLSAGSTIGGAATQAGTAGANAISQGYGEAAKTKGSSLGNAFGAASGILGMLPF